MPSRTPSLSDFGILAYACYGQSRSDFVQDVVVRMEDAAEAGVDPILAAAIAGAETSPGHGKAGRWPVGRLARPSPEAEVRMISKSAGRSSAVVLAFLLATTLRAGEAAERVILQAEATRIQAMLSAELPVLNELLSDDLTYVHSGGELETKQEFIERLRTGQLRYKRFDRDEVRARVYGNTAVITGRASVEVESGSERRAFHIRFLDVWARCGGRWRMVAWQSTRLGPR